MKNYRDLINEVASAQSPADKEFVALHKIIKKQFVDYPEHQFKGGVGKDHTKLSVPSNETGMDDDVEKEKPKQLGEWRNFSEAVNAHQKSVDRNQAEVDKHVQTIQDHLKSSGLKLKKQSDMLTHTPSGTHLTPAVHAHIKDKMTKDSPVHQAVEHYYKAAERLHGLTRSAHPGKTTKWHSPNYSHVQDESIEG